MACPSSPQIATPMPWMQFARGLVSAKVCCAETKHIVPPAMFAPTLASGCTARGHMLGVGVLAWLLHGTCLLRTAA